MACMVGALSVPVLAGNPGTSPGRKYTTLERMTLPHLKALHEDVEKIKKERREVGLKTGLNDYRSILHSHAEDSAHTGGTRPEMLEDAKKVGVNCIMLTDHYRPPHDFINESWRGLHDGVLFIPGSEWGGFLIYPDHSIMGKMDQERSAMIKTITEGEGLIFLSHLEERLAHPMTGLTGTEIYNNHFDAKDDAAAMLGLIGAMTDPQKVAELQEGAKVFPAEMFAAIVDYPELYLRKWDADTQTQRATGVAANDCHHNQVYIVKMVDEETVRVGTIVDKEADMRLMKADMKPGIRELSNGKKPGDILVKLDLDPYARSFLNVSTHILAPELTEAAIRAALKAGHAYVSHDWLCDPTGFAFVAESDGKHVGIMGDEVKYGDNLMLIAEFPISETSHSCEVHLIRNGERAPYKIRRISSGSPTIPEHFELHPDGPGVYRVEGWFTVDGEQRIWIYSNPIYVR